MITTFTLIDLAGSVALLLLGTQMVQTGMHRAFGAGLFALCGGGLQLRQQECGLLRANHSAADDAHRFARIRIQADDFREGSVERVLVMDLPRRRERCPDEWVARSLSGRL